MYCLEVIIKRIIRHVSRSVSTGMRPSPVWKQRGAFLLNNHIPFALVRTHRLELCSRYAQHFCGMTATHPTFAVGTQQKRASKNSVTPSSGFGGVIFTAIFLRFGFFATFRFGFIHIFLRSACDTLLWADILLLL